MRISESFDNAMTEKGRRTSNRKKIVSIVGVIVQWSLVGVVAFVASTYLASALVWVVRSVGVAWSMETTIGATVYRVMTYIILATILGGAIYYRNRDQFVLTSGVVKLLTWKDIGLSLAGTIIYMLSATIAIFVASKIPGFSLEQSQDIGIAQVYGLDRLVVFVVFVVLTPLFEELIFRGFLYGKLRIRAVPWWLSAVVVSALFGLAHMQWNVAIDVFCLSMVACALREVTGSIWAGTLLHIIKNMIAFIIKFVIIQGLVR